jgi:hypothetical protein
MTAHVSDWTRSVLLHLPGLQSRSSSHWWRGIEGARELDCVCWWSKWPASWKPQEKVWWI